MVRDFKNLHTGAGKCDSNDIPTKSFPNYSLCGLLVVYVLIWQRTVLKWPEALLFLGGLVCPSHSCEGSKGITSDLDELIGNW